MFYAAFIMHSSLSQCYIDGDNVHMCNMLIDWIVINLAGTTFFQVKI